MIQPGSTLHVTDSGDRLIVWSHADGPGCYWAHQLDAENRQRALVKVRVRHVAHAVEPVVTVIEEA